MYYRSFKAMYVDSMNFFYSTQDSSTFVMESKYRFLINISIWISDNKSKSFIWTFRIYKCCTPFSLYPVNAKGNERFILIETDLNLKFWFEHVWEFNCTVQYILDYRNKQKWFSWWTYTWCLYKSKLNLHAFALLQDVDSLLFQYLY